jgi:hypothetical protein
MTLSNENYLPGDKRPLFSIFFNSQRSGFVSETVAGATQYASNILEPKKGHIDRHHKADTPIKLGELVASGTVGEIDVDIILEEWTVGEDGCFEHPPITHGANTH